MHTAWAWLTVATAITGPRPEAAFVGALPGRIELQNCFVNPKQKAQVSAEEAGVLAAIYAPEGTQVVTAQRPVGPGEPPIEERPVLARLNDTRARLQRDSAQGDARTAEDQAKSNVNVDFAIAGRNVAKAELQQAQDANRRVPGTVAESEVRRRVFALERSEMQIEQAKLEKTVAQYTLQSKTAALKMAEDNVERQQIRAPFDGIVVESLKQVGEWVNAGDPVLRLVRLDEMWVEGFLNANEYLPSDVHMRRVRVTVPQISARLNAQEQGFEGYVEYVSPEVNPVNGEFRIKALVKNKQQGGHFLLRPGLRGSMTIDLSAPPVRLNR